MKNQDKKVKANVNSKKAFLKWQKMKTFGKRDGAYLLQIILCWLHLAASAGGTELELPHLQRGCRAPTCSEDNIFKRRSLHESSIGTPGAIALLFLETSLPKAARDSSSSKDSGLVPLGPSHYKQGAELRGFFSWELRQRGNCDRV